MGKMSDLTIPDVDPVEMALDKILGESYSDFAPAILELISEVRETALSQGRGEVLRIRCASHYSVHQINKSAGGSECGECARAMGYNQGEQDAETI